MKEETSIGGFHNRLQSYGLQREFLKRHGGTEENFKPRMDTDEHGFGEHFNFKV